MTLYDLSVSVEEIDDGSGHRFIATSPDLPSLLVVGDTTKAQAMLFSRERRFAEACRALEDGLGRVPRSLKDERHQFLALNGERGGAIEKIEAADHRRKAVPDDPGIQKVTLLDLRRVFLRKLRRCFSAQEALG